jgi:hypothetical protein
MSDFEGVWGKRRALFGIAINVKGSEGTRDAIFIGAGDPRT